MHQSNRDLLRLIRTGKPSGTRLTIAIVFSILGTLGLLWYPLLTRDLIGIMGEAGATSDLVMTFAGLLVAVLVGAAIIAAVGDYMLARIGHEVVAMLRHSLVCTLLHLPVTSFDEKETGDRVSRVIGDCQSVSNLATRQVVNLPLLYLVWVGMAAVNGVQYRHSPPNFPAWRWPYCLGQHSPGKHRAAASSPQIAVAGFLYTPERR